MLFSALLLIAWGTLTIRGDPPSQDDHNRNLSGYAYSLSGENQGRKRDTREKVIKLGHGAITSRNGKNTPSEEDYQKNINTSFNILSELDRRIRLPNNGQEGSVTEDSGVFSNNSDVESEGYNTKVDESHRGASSSKSILKTSEQSFAVTTPDAHMNDPPFQGPNVPQEVDHFYGEKDELKEKYVNSQHSVEEASSQPLHLGTDLKHATKLWSLAWDCQRYVLGSLFLITALYSFLSVLRMKTFVMIFDTCTCLTVNLLIFVSSLLRSLYLLQYPSNLTEKNSFVVFRVLYNSPLTLLTSSFSLLMLTLLNLVKLRVLPQKLQSPVILGFVLIFFITLYVNLEFVNFFLTSKFFVISCNVVPLSLAASSSISYFFVFQKLHIKALKKQGEMIRVAFKKMHIDGAQLPKKLPKATLMLAVNLGLVTAILQMVLCCLLPCEWIFFGRLFSRTSPPNLWLWWGHQLCCRLLELAICIVMSFITTQSQEPHEMALNTFCNSLMSSYCRTISQCFRKEELVDFESHSDNYANPHDLRSTTFEVAAGERRLQTNSLPTFRTPLVEGYYKLPLKTLPCSGKNTNHASALSLLSYYRQKSVFSTNEGLENVERSLGNQTMSSVDGRNNSLRPASMLYKDKGFIRFRQENDPEQPMEMSDEEDRLQEVDTSLEDADSTKVNVGSSFHSLLEGDVVNTLSPFFQVGYKRRFRKMSHVSIETTDYSADISSDQLSNVDNLRNGLSMSALDFHTRKYGSTCSSESAANSFDVTFFLNSNSSQEIQTSPTSTTPASLNVFSAYRSETEDDKTSSVEGHEVMLRSVSPVVKRASSGRLSLNLTLHSVPNISESGGHVNVACGTEDITPDSAVFLDLQLPSENSVDLKMPTRNFPSRVCATSPLHPSNSFTKSTEGIWLAERSCAPISPTSHSLDELRTSKSYTHIPRFEKNSLSLLHKLCGSSFPLNTGTSGYEPLEPSESSAQTNRKRLQRWTSNRTAQVDLAPQAVPSGNLWNQATSFGDSGLLGDCSVALVNVASQTEDFQEDVSDSCSHRGSSGSEFQSLLSGYLENKSTEKCSQKERRIDFKEKA